MAAKVPAKVKQVIEPEVLKPEIEGPSLKIDAVASDFEKFEHEQNKFNAEYAKSGTMDFNRLEDLVSREFQQSDFFAKRSAICYWRAGKWLQVIRDKRKGEGGFVQWIEQRGLPQTRIYQAIKFAEHFENPNEIKFLTLNEAKMISGAVKPAKQSDNVDAKTYAQDSKTKTASKIKPAEPEQEIIESDGVEDIHEVIRTVNSWIEEGVLLHPGDVDDLMDAVQKLKEYIDSTTKKTKAKTKAK